MRTQQGTPIRRDAYQPLAYQVETVDLDFVLDPKATVVSNRMRCVRNPQAAAGPSFVRRGPGCLSVRIDGAAPADGQVRTVEGGLEIDVDADVVVLEIVTRIDPPPI
jgi:aminopeptidase N